MSDYKVPFVNFGLAYKKIKPEIDREIQKILANGDLVLRDDVKKFEEKLAKFIGVKYAVGVNSGTDALFIALKAIGIKEGDKVLVPAHTFVSTPQVVNQLGAVPILYDLDYIPVKTNRYKAIIPAHISGKLDMNMLTTEIPVIEDACQALGAEYQGKKAGSFGSVGCFSFYPAKILGASGDAGALVTNDKSIYEFAKEYRNHWKLDYSKWGINSRIDNIQAAILNVKIKYLPEVIERRREIAKQYFSRLPMEKTYLPELREGRVWQDFIIRIEGDIEYKPTDFLIETQFKMSKRNYIYEFLKEKGVETMKNEYPMPIPKLSKAKQYEAETLRLPINETLTNKQIDYVIKTIKEFYK